MMNLFIFTPSPVLPPPLQIPFKISNYFSLFLIQVSEEHLCYICLLQKAQGVQLCKAWLCPTRCVREVLDCHHCTECPAQHKKPFLIKTYPVHALCRTTKEESLFWVFPKSMQSHKRFTLFEKA